MRAASVIAAILGLFASVFCFLGLSGAALPYQDPTPAMLAAQAETIRWWQIGTGFGIVIALSGFIGLWRTRKRRVSG